MKPEPSESRYGALRLCSTLLVHCISVILVWLGYVCKKEAASRQECKFKGKKEMLGGGALGNLDSFPSFAWNCLNYSGFWAKLFNDTLYQVNTQFSQKIMLWMQNLRFRELIPHTNNVVIPYN